MKRRNYNILLLLIIILVTCAGGIVIAYAALNTKLETKFGSITQEALTFDVGFYPYGGIAAPIYPAVIGSANCNAITPDKNSVSGINASFSSAKDRCSYPLVVANNGTIDAQITSITPKKPNNTSCTTANGGSTMVCGNITYKLIYDSPNSTVQPKIGDVLVAKSGSIATTKTIILTAEYTGATSASSEFKQSGFGFTINYGQH